MYLNPNHALSELAKRAFDYKGKQFEAVAKEGHMTISSFWDEGNRSYWAQITVSGEIKKFAGDFGGFFSGPPLTVHVTPDQVLARHQIYRGGEMITLYIHPDRFPKQLQTPEELPRDEKIVLVATRSLKSSYAGVSDYRYHEAHLQTNISRVRWDTAKADLISKGLLRSNGSITPDGKNAIGDMQLYSLKGD